MKAHHGFCEGPCATDSCNKERDAEAIIAALRVGKIPPDRVFDRHLPHDLALASREFWTPLEVALKAASWLREIGARTVLDIGAGVGKFCVAAALDTECVYLGIEHRPRLVAVAEALARRFGVERTVGFIEGAFGNISVGGIDAVYLYNPFGENLCWQRDRLDDTVKLGRARFRHDVTLAERFFESLPAGVRVITYNGFGGRMPSSFTEERTDCTLPNVLQMWRKETTTEPPQQD